MLNLKGISLVHKVFIVFLVVILPIIIVLITGFRNNRQELERLLFNQLRSVADEREAYLLIYLEMNKSRIIDFASDGFIINALETLGPGNKKITSAVLDEYMRKYKLPLLKEMYRLNIITSMDGRVLASTLPGLIGENLSKEEFFKKGLTGASVTEVVSIISGRKVPEIAVSVPIRSRTGGGKILGVLTGFTEISKFSEFFTGEYIKKLGALTTWTSPERWSTFEIYLVNRDRLMITQSRFVKDSALNLKVDTLPVKDCLEAGKEFTGIYNDYRGEPVIGASMCLPAFGWTLVTEVDVKEVLRPVARIQEYLIVTVILITGLVGALVLYFFRVIVLQLRTLAHGAGDIASGNYNVTVPVTTRDEIGLLASSFNEMATKIKDRTTELENSTKMLEEAQEIARLGGWEWDIQSNRLKWSDELYRMYGISVGMPMTYEEYLNTIHPEDRESVRRAVDESLRRGTPYLVEYRSILPGGRSLITRAQGKVLLDQENKPFKMKGICQDITAIREVEKSLQESEMKYRTLVESMQEGIWVIDSEGVTTYVNPKMAEMLGYTVSEMAGRHVTTFVPQEGVEAVKKRLEKRRKGIYANDEVEYQKKDGSRIYARIAGAPILEKGEYRGAIAGVIDITDRKLAEDALRESEERLRAILDNMGNPVYMRDMEGKIVFVNRALIEASGMTSEAIIGKTIFDALPEEKAAEVHRTDLQALETGGPIQVEVELALAGGVRTFLVIKFALQDTKGKKYAICGVATEITSLKRTEEALRKSEKSLKDAQRIAHIGNWEWDLADNSLFLSEEVQRICGKQSEEAEKFEHFFSTLHDKDGARLKKAAQDAVYSGKPFSQDIRIIRADGAERILHIQGEVIRDESGRPLRMAGTVQDITERKRAEDEVIKLNRELEARVEARTRELAKAMSDLASANREIETFTYSVAHDLRSPLRLIDGFSLLLEKKHREKLDRDGQDNLYRIREAVKRMGQLIDDLLNLSFVMRAEIKSERVDLSTLAGSIASDFKKADPDRPIEFRIEEGLAAKGDEKLLRMALENLIGNAWKFTSKKTEQKIEFGSSGTKDGKGVFFVRDNGAGFDMKDYDRLFEPFQRLHPPGEYPGTGIGLPTVQRIIQRHSGDIWAESEPNAGAVFFFTLEKEE